MSKNKKNPFYKRRNQQRRHGEDGEYAKEFNLLETWPLERLEAELEKLLELRKHPGLTVQQNGRLRACLAAIVAKRVEKHSWRGGAG